MSPTLTSTAFIAATIGPEVTADPGRFDMS